MTTFSPALLGVGCAADSSNAPRASLDQADTRFFFDFDIALRSASRLEGRGAISFRQPVDADVIAYLDTRVSDLLPKAAYQLQRAIDSVLDGVCTGTNWITLGAGTVAQDIVTDAAGDGSASLYRSLGVASIGSTFDITFRLVNAGTSEVVLTSNCHRFTVRQ
jgi:hypothetical protein